VKLQLAAALSTSLGLLTFGLHGSAAAEKFPLRSGAPEGVTQHVTANLEVGGHLKVAGEKDKKSNDIPMSVVAQFSYDEQRIDDGKVADHRLSIRCYEDAQAVIKIAENVVKPQLRNTRRLIAATAAKDNGYLTSAEGPLTREELDLIDIPGNTLLLDTLLPNEDVEKGYRWKPSDTALGELLGLDAVGHSEVECVLVDVANGVAEITLEGTLGGAINGVSSDIELKGKLLFNVDRKLFKSVVLAIKEQRGIGNVGPGLDVVAKLKLTIQPVDESKLLTATVVQNAQLPTSDEAPALEYVSTAKGYRFQYDWRWHITREEPDLVVMRFVDRGDLIAQCNVAPSTKALEKAVDLAQFQNDVQTALGKLFGNFERASERTTDSGLRILTSIASGSAQDLTIQWRYYLAHDKQGRGLGVIFTMEQALAKQFNDNDKQIVESVEFLEPKVASKPVDSPN
jgi:hypothetical protein